VLIATIEENLTQRRKVGKERRGNLFSLHGNHFTGFCEDSPDAEIPNRITEENRGLCTAQNPSFSYFFAPLRLCVRFSAFFGRGFAVVAFATFVVRSFILCSAGA
jgi:hypothetical protein